MKGLIRITGGAAACVLALPILVVVALLSFFGRTDGSLSEFEAWYAACKDVSIEAVSTASASQDGARDFFEAPADLDEDGRFRGYDQTQLGHASTIATVAAEHGLPMRAVIVGIATAIQESRLRNLANPSVPESLEYDHDGTGSDHDSVGVFQQRPSMGWGTVAEIMDPAYAAGKFFDKLASIDGWESMSVAEAAQAVQVSAFPDAYAEHEEVAADIAEYVTGGHYSPTGCAGGQTIPVGAEGWVHPLPGGTFTSGYRTAERPGHDGIDIAAAKGTPVYAAAAGTVIFTGCDLGDAGGSCDEDGSLEAAGCGWYLQIEHEGGVQTRYCHLQYEPEFRSNEGVEAGQVVGYVGSSGRSSGPHLHFEVQLPLEGSFFGEPTDPVAFMADRGIDLQG